jgi:transposase
MTRNKFPQITDDRIYIGLDVAKDSLAVYIDATKQHSECLNQAKALRALAKKLKKLNPTLIVLEATGGYETLAAVTLSEFELPFTIVYPRRVRQFAYGLGVIAKTDEVDAEVLAYYGRVAQLPARPLLSPEWQELQALTTRRQQLLEMRLMEDNRLATAHPSLSKNIKKHRDWLQHQIEEIETELQQRIQTSEAWQPTDEILQSAPGVGQVLSTTLITELPELGQLTHKEIASLVGVAPFPAESGKFKGKRFCRGGRNSIRRVLYMATLNASRYNPIIKQFYDHLVAQGKPKKVALIACARKLLTILNAMVRNNSPWQPKSISLLT